MTPMETAEALGYLRDSCGWTVPAIASSVGMKIAEVESYLELLNLIPEARRSIDKGTLSVANGIVLSRRSPEVQRRLYKRATVFRTTNLINFLREIEERTTV